MLLAAIFVLLILVASSIFRSGTTQENELRVISSCLCPGCELVVECTVTGDGAATIWQGTIFEGCLNEMIALRHSGFISGIMIQESCRAREPVVVRSVSVANGSFTSQLLVNISEDLLGTIECANESGQIIGSKQIDISSEIFPPPTIILSEINTDQLTFAWNSIATNVSGVQYFVSTSNCGVCPNTTYSTSVRCNSINITSNLHECSLTILTMVCGRNGSGSDPFIVRVRVPHSPTVQVIQVTEGLTLITTSFNKTELISLNDGTTVPATSYTISYSDSSTGETCGLSTIPASSCGERICSNVFELSSTSCFNFANIAVSFFANSSLGNGPASGQTLISLQNSIRGQDYPICMNFGDITNTLITSGVVALLIQILITAVFISVTVLLIRSKRLMQKELKDIKESQDSRKKGDTVYDEIKPLPESTVIETTENTAYTCISRMCANASL